MTEELTKLRDALRRVKHEAASLADAQVIALEALTAAQPAQVQEPFGHFRAEPFGWTACAETDEGAVALYERPVPEVFTLQELHDLDRAIDDFNDCGETDVDDKLLMRGAQAGFLECARYEAVNREALQAAMLAAAPQGADHG